MGFDWDDDNLDHIARHQVEPEEAEEALSDPDLIVTDAYNTPTEQRAAVVGATEDGRILFVVYMVREARFRVVTARDANKSQKRAYRG